MSNLRLARPLVVFDLETTGVDPEVDRIVEIATLKLSPDGERESRRRLIHPERPIPPEATAVHGIRDEDVRDAPPFRRVAQFGVPIGSFQAVQHRLADAYIDVQSMRWVMWRAAWKLTNGQDATREVAVSKFWAAEGGARVAASAQHLHGGMWVDIDYPIHRYFL